MPDIQEAKFLEFTVQVLPPPLGAPRGGKKNFGASRKFGPNLDLFLYTPLLKIVKNSKLLNLRNREP